MKKNSSPTVEFSKHLKEERIECQTEANSTVYDIIKITIRSPMLKYPQIITFMIGKIQAGEIPQPKGILVRWVMLDKGGVHI